MKVAVTPEKARQIEVAKRAAKVPGDVRRELQLAALQSQQVDMSKVYYSRIRFQFALADGTLTLVPGDRYAFGYKLQEEVQGHPGHAATYADTNLLEERSTNRGERTKILGMSIRPTPFTDSYLMNAIDMFMSVTLRLDQQNVVYIGNPSDVPGASQNAEGPSWVLLPDAEQVDIFRGYQATKKGEPNMDNVLVFKEPIIWTPSGPDSKMDVLFRMNETWSFDLPADRVATDVTAAGAGDNAVITAWTQPAEEGEPGTFVDYDVRVYVDSRAPRSQNM